MKMGWQTKNLGEVLKIQNGYAFDSKKFNPSDGLPLVRIRSLKAGEETETRYSGDYDKKYLVRAGDLLVGMDGEFGCYEWKGEPALLNQRVCRLQDFSKEIVPRFLFYGLNDYLKAIEDVTGFATVKHLSSKQILAIEFPVPPLPEQQRIVAKLDEAFEGIATAKENAERNVKNARAIFESELNAIFTKKGEGWEDKRLGEVCSFSSGGTPSKGNNKYWDGDIPWVSGRDMKSTRLSDATLHISQPAVDESATRMVPAGSLLALVRGMGLAHGAQIAEVMSPCAFNQDIKAIHPKKGIVARYLLFALKVRINSDDTLLSNAAHGTLRLDTERLRNVKIPMPDQHRQGEIVRKIDALAEESENLGSVYQRKITALDALKKSLLHHAFTGQL